MAIQPGLSAQCGDHVRHRQDKHRHRQRGADPEALGHVMQLGILFLIRTRRHCHRFQRHAALGTIAGMVLLHFRMHRAGVQGLAQSGRDRCWATLRRDAGGGITAHIVTFHLQ